jgi:hypothetical protein
MFTKITAPQFHVDTNLDSVSGRETPLVDCTDAEQQQANPWTYLSGYDFADEPEYGFDWLPGHA